MKESNSLAVTIFSGLSSPVFAFAPRRESVKNVTSRSDSSCNW